MKHRKIATVAMAIELAAALVLLLGVSVMLVAIGVDCVLDLRSETAHTIGSWAIGAVLIAGVVVFWSHLTVYLTDKD